jgi:hypothetical protein
LRILGGGDVSGLAGAALTLGIGLLLAALKLFEESVEPA